MMRVRWKETRGGYAGSTVFLSADLVQSGAKGKPETIPLFTGVCATQRGDWTHCLAWNAVNRTLDRLNLPPAQRARLEAAVTARVPRLTVQEQERAQARVQRAREALQGMARAIRADLEAE